MRNLKSVILSLLSICFLAGSAMGQDAKFNYVGAADCKKCHNTAKTGAAYKIWLETKHAQAYTTLASEESKKIAKEKGIADPQKAKECLKCHVTAYDVEASRLGPKYSVEEGVGCESCHGAGSEYNSKKVKTALMAGEITHESVGLVMDKSADACKKCHNSESPTFKEFNFDARWKEIAHPKPE